MTAMDFAHEHYPYHIGPHQQQEEQQQQEYHDAHPSLLPYQHHPAQPQHVEAYYPVQHHTEYPDYGSITPDRDDFEGCSEILTRPRLTKEQVEVLEAQFQAHPKPNSSVKRQLALQTKLTLPRVANWFQNRRAKAKQMKKQEEFEMTKDIGIGEAWNNDHHIPTGYTIPLQIDTAAAAASRSLPSASSGEASQPSTSSSSAEAISGQDVVQDASWASLQRALNAANTARDQYLQDEDREVASLPYRRPAQRLGSSLPQDHSQLDPPSFHHWNNDTPPSEPWQISLQQHSGNGELDHGFGRQSVVQHGADYDIVRPRTESPDVTPYVISSDIWTSTVPTPTITSYAPAGKMALHESDSLPMPCYPSTRRRESSSDELTSTLDQFVLAGTPPMRSPIATRLDQFRKPEHNIDLAARRKRPRPAALGSAALRSQSYGAPSAMSPTFRISRQSQNPYPIRHVKSTGQNLNVTYAGIRKPSIPQRSPLNVATFAEAEEFSSLMAQQKFSNYQSESEQAVAPPSPLSNADIKRTQLPILEEPIFSENEYETPNQYFMNEQPSRFNMASPPSTPLKSDFFSPSIQSMMPPMSAPPQYAIFPDYTPPYSAGPLTTSSWPDAPLTSPEMAPFSPALHMSQQAYVSPVMREYSTVAPYPNHLVSHSLAEQKQTDVTAHAHSIRKPTEFFIQEFPRQKEEHALAAQQMARQKPKNYVFANATPSDF